MKRTLGLNLLVAGVSLALVLAAGEAWCRAGAARKRAQREHQQPLSSRVTIEAPAPFLYKLRPNIPGLTNAEGFRDIEHTRAKPPATLRIAVIGDSVSMQSDIDFGALYHQVLARRLEQRFPGRIEVLNFGVTGYETGQEAAVLSQDALAYDPDIVLWQFHDNDGVRAAFDTVRGRFYARPVSYLARSIARRIDHLCMKLFLAAHGYHELGHEARHLAFSLDRVTSIFADVTRDLRQRQIALCVVLYPHWPAGDDWRRYGAIDRQLHHTLASRLRTLGARVVDLLAVFERHDPARLRVRPEDPWHPNTQGHALMGEALVADVAALVAQRLDALALVPGAKR